MTVARDRNPPVCAMNGASSIRAVKDEAQYTA
jgi:hypothetical protein